MKLIPKNKPFKLFPCCISTKGYSKSILYDLNRSAYWYLPNDLHDIIIRFTGKTINFVLSQYEKTDQAILEEYFEFLVKNEFLLFADTPQELARFESLETTFCSPRLISNAVLQINQSSDWDIEKQVADLTSLGCQSCQLVFTSILSFHKIESILHCFENSAFKEIELLFQYSKEYTNIHLLKLAHRYNRISKILIHSCPHIKGVNVIRSKKKRLIRTGNVLPENLFSPIKNEQNFQVNMSFYCESKNHNPYLNQKIFIGSTGEIKNAPNSERVFGNCKSTSIQDIVNKNEFQQSWFVKKDDIPICKDCEYRYMCMDNRIPVKKRSRWVHELSCLYDVYNGVWKTN